MDKDNENVLETMSSIQDALYDVCMIYNELGSSILHMDEIPLSKRVKMAKKWDEAVEKELKVLDMLDDVADYVIRSHIKNMF